MSYIEKSISIFGTELQFLQAFINAITEADWKSEESAKVYMYEMTSDAWYEVVENE